MSLSLKGPEGVQTRIQELQARMAQHISVRKNPRVIYQDPEQKTGIPNEDFGSLLEGSIGSGGGIAPMRPNIGSIMPSSASAETLRPMIAQIATEEGVDPSLLEALVSVESNFNSRAVSHAGAKGLTQLMPGTAKALGVTDPFDPVQSLRGGAKYLRQMISQFGDVPTALAAYNAGPGNVRRYNGIPPFTETQNYVRKVQERHGLLAGGMTNAR